LLALDHRRSFAFREIEKGPDWPVEFQAQYRLIVPAQKGLDPNAARSRILPAELAKQGFPSPNERLRLII
jgi:hypothetical protein